MQPECIITETSSPVDVSCERMLNVLVIDVLAFTTVDADDKMQQ